MGFCGWSTHGPCTYDGECRRAGCDVGFICMSMYEEPPDAICEGDECLVPERYGYACRCVNGRCMWFPPQA